MHSQAWKALGEQLGLAPEGPSLMTGRRCGHSVQVQRAADAQQQGGWDTQCAARMPSLNLGLGMVRRANAQRAGNVEAIGVQAFDAAFVVEAADPERARAMLLHKAGDGADVVDLCLWAASNDWALRTTDDAVRLDKQIALDDVSEPGQALDMATHLAMRLQWAYRMTPSSAAEQRIRDDWAAVARSRALEIDPERLRMQGRVGVVACEACRVAGADLSFATVATALLDKPLQVELRLGRGGAISGLDRYMGMLDIHLGVEFERLFTVQGCPPDRARRLLTAPVRAALLALLRRGAAVEVTDTSMRVAMGQLLEGAALEGLLVDLSAAATALQQAAARR